MNQLTTIPTFAALQAAVLERLHAYLGTHGGSLESLLRQARADTDVDERVALQELADGVLATRDARKLVIRIRALTDELLCVLGEPMVEIEGAFCGREIDTGFAWHAARLTDLERDIKFAFRV
ncbi:hypothetical protein LR948_12140 [Roseivivax sp. GX 12232]|uniref:hypothetical protein n=1 Tax=Roseivivax sp. GX 12232 TaxID=2900547 RepID=UPI001E32301E|nr:hypothetical protein [Roseivivax sp. GX 12232]MCE0506111.1 hypothetical protein [Roseivivax sp. GX 12232]